MSPKPTTTDAEALVKMDAAGSHEGVLRDKEQHPSAEHQRMRMYERAQCGRNRYSRGVVCRVRDGSQVVALCESQEHGHACGECNAQEEGTISSGQPGPFRELCTLSLFNCSYRTLLRGFAFAPKALNQFPGGGHILYILDAQSSH
jgi:hypothetical protein